MLTTAASAQTLSTKFHHHQPPLSASSSTISAPILNFSSPSKAEFMACKLDKMMLHFSSMVENDCFGKSCTGCRNYNSLTEYYEKRYLFGPTSEFVRKGASCLIKSSRASRHGWRIAFALDTGSVPGNNDPNNLNGVSSGLGGTRLGRIVGTGARQLLEKLNSARKNFPMKIFLLLLGFYTANALATILGQTGDWDVLVAGVVVAAIEGIGMLMYRKSSSLSTGRLQSLVVMVNYWKAGVCLGLFVDAFKLGS